jgi:hypothetical protein
MIIFTDIVNDNIINIDDIKPWLLKNCEKWIILNKKTNIYIIFLLNKSARLDSIIRSFKGFIFKINEHVKINTKKINQEENFSQILKTYFCKTNNTFDNIKLKGYTKKYLLSLLEKNNDDSDDDINIKICSYCSKSFKTKFNKTRHEKICKKKTIIDEKNNNSIVDNKDELKEELKEELKDFKNEISNMFKEFNKEFNDKITNVQQVSQIQQVTNTTNNVNIQINNYKTKKDKLNHYLKNMIDLDTFTDNYKNNEKYHLTKDEALILLENFQNLGISSYGDGLLTYIKKKYAAQLEDLTGDQKKYHEVILPFICSDINLRNHYELTSNGWLLNKNNDKIKNIVTISDQQIFNHHNRFICYSAKKGKNTVINIFLRKSDYSQIEPQLTDSPTTSAIEA